MYIVRIRVNYIVVHTYMYFTLTRALHISSNIGLYIVVLLHVHVA